LALRPDPKTMQQKKAQKHMDLFVKMMTIEMINETELQVS